MATFEDVTVIASGWPGVTVETSYGTPALKVGGKGFCRMWGEREHNRDNVHDTEVLVVMCDVDEKPALIDSSDGVLFSTDHYDGYGAMLVRLSDVTPDDLRDPLEDSYRIKATPKLLAEFGET